MDKEPEFINKIKKFAVRLKYQRMEEILFKTILYGFCLSFVLVILDKLFILPRGLEDTLIPILIVCAGSILLGLFIGFVQKVVLMDAAIKAEQKLDLKERLSSGVECINLARKGKVVQALIDDAYNSSKRHAPWEVFPHKFPTESKLSTGLFICMVAVFLIPGEDYLVSAPEPVASDVNVTYSAAVKEEGEHLENISKKLENKTELNETKELLKKLENLSKEMQKNMTKEDALAKISNLSDEINKKKDKLSSEQEDIESALDRAALELANSNLTRTIANDLLMRNYGSASNEIKKLADDVKDGKYSEGDLKNMGVILKNAGEVLIDTPAEYIGKDFSSAGDSLFSMDKTSGGENLNNAAEKIGNLEGMQDNIKDIEEIQTELFMGKQNLANSGSGRSGSGTRSGSMGTGGNATGSGSGSSGTGVNATGTGTGNSGTWGNASGTGTGNSGTGGNASGTGGNASGTGGNATGTVGSGTSNTSGERCPGGGSGGSGGSGDSGGSGTGSGSGVGGTTAGTGTTEHVIFTPRRVDTKGVDISVTPIEGDGETYTSDTSTAPPTTAAGSYVSYSEVYTEYKDVAEDSIYRENIPIGYKMLVKDYFDSINPDNDDNDNNDV